MKLITLKAFRVIIERDVESNINITINKYGNTPLHYATMNISKECLELLIRSGGDVNARNNDEDTPLHLSVIHNSKKCSELLIRSGGDITIRNNDRKTPLDYIRNEDYKEYILKLVEEVSALENKDPGFE